MGESEERGSMAPGEEAFLPATKVPFVFPFLFAGPAKYRRDKNQMKLSMPWMCTPP